MTTEKTWEASAESKAKAKQLRLFAILAWIVAMAGQIFAIFKLIHNNTLVWLIVAIVVILALAITGSSLWKKANKLDPASEKDKVKFFLQNQLGAIMGVLAFLPLVILIFMDKNIDGKTKGIAGSIAVVAMLLAGITGIDFNPPSVEKYTKEINEQTATLNILTPNSNTVYWTTEGNKYHVYNDCYHIKGHQGISNGTIKDAFDKKGLSELCKTCQEKAMKERNIKETDLVNPVKDSTGKGK